jgi:Ca2+-transporting ATPase
MTVMEVFTDMTPYTLDALDAHTHHAHEVLLKAAKLNSNAVVKEDGTGIGDPTEIALVQMFDQYMEKHPHFVLEAKRLEEIPFDSERKLMSISSEHHLYTKGACDQLLERCSSILMGTEKRPITQEDKDLILTQNALYAEKGLRVLGFAYKQTAPRPLDYEDENDLCFVGLVAQQDPPRVESAQAVKAAKEAGIKPIMITGDHVVTAKAIARAIGIFEPGDMALEGRQLDAMSDEELAKVLDKVSVYARVAPEHKIRIVRLWQDKGQIVAMTGDGVNDAPALILADDNFATIVKAVESGRNVYANIQNAIIYLLSGNLSAIIMVAACSLLNFSNPFTAVQLLFINLVTDSLPAIAIGMEPDHKDVLKEKPRSSKESILNGYAMKSIGMEGFLIFLAVMAAYLYGAKTSAVLASTMAFSTLTLSRLLHGFSQRGAQPIWKLPVNKYSFYAFGIGVALLAVILTVPAMQSLFDAQGMTVTSALVMAGLSLLSFVLVQLWKAWSSRG